MSHYLRPALLALLLSQLANESSNSLSAALLPWAASNQGVAPVKMLLGLALMCGLLAVISVGVLRLSATQNIIRIWWPTCVFASIVMAAAALMPGNSLLAMGVAAMVLICAEPIIEMGTSVLLPEQAQRMGWNQTELNGLLLFVGGLSTALAPLCLPMLARVFELSTLIDIVLMLGVVGVLSLAPLRHGLHGNESPSADGQKVQLRGAKTLKTALWIVPSALCLIVTFEAVLLPVYTIGRTDALSLQSWFVTCLALGAALGGIVTATVVKLARHRGVNAAVAIAAIVSLLGFCSTLQLWPLLLGASLTGIWVGLVLPFVEAAVQAQGATPEQRIAPLAKFSCEVACRCGGLFLLLAGLAAALNLHSPT